ncbi:MAG: WD40 repeat domain-containing protein, partial [Gemmataceae bacterium]
PLPQAIPVSAPSQAATLSASSLSIKLAEYGKQGVALARRWPRAALGVGGAFLLLLVWMMLPGSSGTKGKERPPPGELTAEFEAIAARARASGGDPKKARQELIDFRLNHPDTDEARQALQVLGKVAVPLDALGQATLPPEEEKLGAAAGVIAIMGEQRQRHWGGVNDVVFSPSGNLLLSAGGADRLIRLWDPATMRPAGPPLAGHSSYVRSLAMRSDGDVLASAGNDGVRLWRRRGTSFDGTPVSLSGYRGTVSVLAWRPDGSLLALGGSSSDVWLWDLSDGYFMLPEHSRYVSSLSFSPSGKWLCTVDGNGRLALWELGKMQATRRRTLRLDTLRMARFLTDELIVGGTGDGEVKLWSFSDNEITPVDTVERPSSIVALAAGKNSRNFVTSESDGSLCLWDTASRQLRILSKEQGPLQPFGSLAVTTGLIAAASRDGTVSLFTVNGGKMSERFPLRGSHRGRVVALSASPRGRLLASAGFHDAAVRFWDLEAPARRSLSRLKIEPPAFLHALAFSPDGSTLAAAGYDHLVHLWSIDGAEARAREPLRGHTRPISGLAFSPRGNVLASIGDDGALWVWSNPPRRTQVPLSNQDRFVGISFNATGEILAVARESGSIVLFDIVNGEAKRKSEFTIPGGAQIRAITFAPIEFDIKTERTRAALVVGNDSGHVNIWDVSATRPKEGQYLDGHRQPITALAFNPTGDLLASADEEGKVIVWQFKPERRLKEWKLPGGVAALTFTIEGRYLATGNYNGSIYLFRAQTK